MCSDEDVMVTGMTTEAVQPEVTYIAWSVAASGVIITGATVAVTIFIIMIKKNNMKGI